MCDTLIQITAVTLGGSSIGGAVCAQFGGDGPHVWIGAGIGALFGFAISFYDVIRTRGEQT